MSDVYSPTGRPTWFGPESAPLFGVVHSPAAGHVRGGIVICPPLGKEHIDTYGGLKLLAQELSAAGFVVLRFDYLGTGDSARDQGADSALDDYRSSIEQAVRYLRDGGAADIALVGLRMGALLAASVAPAVSGLRSIVLWDPVLDGRRYLRQQRVLYKTTVGDDVVDVESEAIIGLAFSKATADQLRVMKMPTAVSDSAPVLVLSRPELMDDERLTNLAAQPNWQVRSVDGQAEFVEPASFVVDIPQETIALIASWIDANMPRPMYRFHPQFRSRAVVAELSGGRQVVEVIDEIGPNRLFGIRTALAGAGADAPALLTHTTAAQHRIGPGRIWTETAREAAGLGMAALRFDRRGTGDTGVATAEFPRIYSAESKQDVVDAVEATGVSADRLIMVGVCSGAWNAAYGAVQRGAKAVVMVNIILYSWRKVEAGPERLLEMTPRNPGAAPKPEVGSARALVKKALKRWLPYWVWLILGRLGLTQVPEILLKELRRNNVKAELVLSPEDFVWFERQRGERAIARLADESWSPVVTPTPTGDHPLIQRDIQNLARRHLLEVAVKNFGPLLDNSGSGGRSASSMPTSGFGTQQRCAN